MYIQFLVEDESGGILIKNIMEKYKEEVPGITINFDIKPYKGIGEFNKGRNSTLVKSEQLLNDLPKRIRAYNSKFRNIPNTSLFVVIDNDNRDTVEFREQLESTANGSGITIDRVFCISIEEIEAWLLGDISAIKLAYPKQKGRVDSKHSQYTQDEIRSDGTWEFLFDLLNPIRGGKTRKIPIFPESSKYKCEWAKEIGARMNIRENKSNSFNYFLDELDKRRMLMV